MTPEDYDRIATQQHIEHIARMEDLERSIAEANAVKSEFDAADPDAVETAEAVRAHVVELVPDAKIVIKELLLHADSEAVRAGLAKFVMAAGMKALQDKGDRDELGSLLKSLQPDAAQ
jgi:hypothetical protein